MINVLIPLDGSDIAESAVRHVLPLLHPFDASVTLLRVIAPNEFRAEKTFNRADWRMQLVQARSYLERVAAVFESADIPCRVRVREGQPADIILKTAQEIDTRLLVMSSCGLGGAFRFVRGGEASKTLSMFGASVLLVDGRGRSLTKGDVRYRRLLVPLDGSCHSGMAFRVAMQIAESTGAEIVISLIVEQPRIPSVLRNDSWAASACQEIVRLAKADADRHLDVLRSSMPRSINVRSSVRLTQVPDQTVAELQQRFASDLIVCSRDLVHAGNGAGDVRQSQLNVPMLLLNSDNAGQAYQERYDAAGLWGAPTTERETLLSPA